MATKLIRWFSFNIIIALLPFGLSIIRYSTKGITPTMDVIFSNGELFLVASAISAGAIGELIGSSPKLPSVKLIVGGLSLVLLVITSYWFAEISGLIFLKADYDKRFVAIWSVILLAFTAINQQVV